MIFNIQKCSIHDGDGLRTLVFFKGCPLRCPWCANPESQRYQAEIMESVNRCIGCGLCRTVCEADAISETLRIDRSRCTRCFRCTEICYAESKRVVGKTYSIEELFTEIEKDRPFYALYGGGVTFSGGEPLTHPNYLCEIAKRCKEKGVHVVVESCGYGNFEEFEAALPFIDAMFMDIKLIDARKHEEITGVDNHKILDNIRRISAYGIPITIRTPIIPGYTDDEENIQKIAQFICDLPSVKEYELLAYHNFGEAKYGGLGRTYALKGVEPPEDQEMQVLVRAANKVLQPCGKTCFYTKNNRKEIVR